MKNENKPGQDFIGVGCGVFIVNEKGETLLSVRSKSSKNEIGTWNKIGGAVEYGETVVEGLKREVMEEIGVKLKDIVFLSYTDHILVNENQHWLGLNYMAKIKEGFPKNLEPDKNDEIKWFKFIDIPKNLAVPTRESLPLMIKKYDEIGWGQ